MEKINFESLPSEDTPVNAINMNKMQDNIDTAKIEKMARTKSLNAVGWYRVAKYNNDGVYSKTFIININTVFANVNNMSAIFAINLAFNKAKITNISNIINGTTIDGIRVVQENNSIYIEVHYNATVANTVWVDIIDQKYSDAHCLSMLTFETATDTATVLDEFTIGNMIISNENGTATKFSDGTMIVRGTVKPEVTFAQWGGEYSADCTTAFNFPVPFKEKPVITMTNIGDAAASVIRCVSNTTAIIQISLARGNVSNGGYTLSYIAIGRWK